MTRAGHIGEIMFVVRLLFWSAEPNSAGEMFMNGCLTKNNTMLKLKKLHYLQINSFGI